MNIVVLLAPVLDPKWTITADIVRDASRLAAIPRRLSPFDEAALEVALKLRDTCPAARIAVYMPDGPGAEGLLRIASAHKVDSVARLSIEDNVRWDAGAMARQLGDTIERQQHGAAATEDVLLLLGREFGDSDDGAFAAALAHRLDARLVTMAEVIGPDEAGTLRARRSRFDTIEQIRVPRRAVIAITNHTGNRLRHPLMKHVMLARRTDIPLLAADAPAPFVRVSPLSFEPLDVTRPARLAPIPASAGLSVQVQALVNALLHPSTP